MSKVKIMGMTFEEGSEPDFGSIYRVREGTSGVHEYGLNSDDVDKLDIITNAAPGSTALCDDTADIYRLTKTGWVMFGESGSDQSNASLNLSPLNFNKSDIDTLDDPEFDEPAIAPVEEER